jgi:uncharacterized RDD family membrane protein YckC
VTTPPEPVDAPAPATRPPGPATPASYPFAPPGTPGPVPHQPGYGPPRTGYTAPQGVYGPPPGYYPPQIPVSPSGHRLAEFSDRLLARLIDVAIIGAVSAIFLVPLYIYLFLTLFRSIPTDTTVNGDVITPQLFEPANFFLQFLGLIAAAFVLGVVINYVYQVELTYRSGQTVGKRVMKIQILPVDPARTLTRAMAAKRFVAEYGCNLIPGLSWIDGLWQLWDKPWQQCLHDKFAQTLVIKLNP